MASVNNLTVPEGFQIDEYATELGSPRFMALSPDNILFVTVIGDGTVVALPDRNMDGKSEEAITFIKGLKRPHGIAFHDGYIYVGETNQIVRYKYNGFEKEHGEKEIIVSDLPTKGHFTRTVSFGPDGKMYVSIGSSCNVCIEKDKRRATIMRFNPDGTGGEIFATGLRNSVGLTWNSTTKDLWATDNGRDWLGDNLPPDEVNIIKENKDYGWPYCYGDKIPDPEFGNLERCKNTIAPIVELQAHSAPLGLTFYEGKMFPPDYQDDLFVAFHGSWNRTIPTGYKVVRVKMKDGEPQGVEDFASGWMTVTKKSGRPVDVLVGKKGELYISDDLGGIIYRITSQ
ncbi:MAG: L-sorbosone dehydrogenase [Thermodesulfobacteriota bacterium]|nr:MAG: L-sorbosone dehydrogenase [Thermodesulfobacteriota bacterium]